jgi:hypothetical protein
MALIGVLMYYRGGCRHDERRGRRLLYEILRREAAEKVRARNEMGRESGTTASPGFLVAIIWVVRMSYIALGINA